MKYIYRIEQVYFDENNKIATTFFDYYTSIKEAKKAIKEEYGNSIKYNKLNKSLIRVENARKKLTFNFEESTAVSKAVHYIERERVNLPL